jgi:Cof subfamily protein (haloacid dehalogenase superfamily)
MLSRDATITRRVKDAVTAVRAAGVNFTISTGRMYPSAARFARELEIDLPLITYQGALVKNSFSGQVLLYRPLPLVYAREIITRVHTLGYHINGYLDNRLLVERDTPAGRRYAAMSGVEMEVVGDLNHFFDCDPTKILVIAEENELEQLQAELSPLYLGKVHIVRSKPHFLEISNIKATKGDALAYLARYFGVQREEIMAVGDSFNDIEMLEYAGLGVVVANAREEIKKVANYVTSEPYGEGVVEALERYVLGYSTHF